MTNPLPTPDWLVEDLGDWESRCGEEEAWERLLDGDGAPALATPVRVLDLQHWLDLCA
jgi:hypothetical protein